MAPGGRKIRLPPCFTLPPEAAEGFHGPEAGGGAAFNADLLEDAAEVLFDGLFTHVEDGSDVSVALALGHP